MPSTGHDYTSDRFVESPQPERAFTLVSLVLSLASLGIAGANEWVGEVDPWVLAAKDFMVFLVLLILMLFFFVRYRQVLKDRELGKIAYGQQLSLIRELITQQAGFYHQVISQTRAHFYNSFGADIYPHRYDYQNPALNDILMRSLSAVVTVPTNIVRNHLQMDGIDEKISISVKALVSRSMATSLCSLSEREAGGLVEGEIYVITLERDSDTKISGKREVLERAYSLRDNTDFNMIYSGNGDHFLQNDLHKFQEESVYKNQNPKWAEQYGATLVVPIAHKTSQDARLVIFGFLTIDSPNKKKSPRLFTTETTKPIMDFGADLLALILLNLEMYDRMPPVKTEERQT